MSKTDMKAIPTEYRGYLFRSRLEARWAVFLDALDIRWEYEPEGLILSNGTYYLPDFYLIDFHLYFEVKRKGLRWTEEGREAIRKISDGMYSDTWAGLICFGDPMDDELIIFCQETDDDGGGCYEDGEVTIGIHPETKEPCLFADDWKERSFFDSFDSFTPIPVETTLDGKYHYSDFITQRVLQARKKARQAQFERRYACLN